MIRFLQQQRKDLTRNGCKASVFKGRKRKNIDGQFGTHFYQPVVCLVLDLMYLIDTNVDCQLLDPFFN